MKYLRLIRWPNLLITWITQCIFYYVIIRPGFRNIGLDPNLEGFPFIALLICTASILSGGYIINDIRDRSIDMINKPSRVIVGTLITVKTAWVFYMASLLLTLPGIIFFVFGADMPAVGTLLLISTGVLYAYSTKYKGVPLLGNLLVSFLCASVLLLFVAAEWSNLQIAASMHAGSRHMHIILGFFAVFAFMSNFIREMVKDLEDQEGDAHHKLRTVATAWGISRSKQITFITAAILFLLILLSIYLEWYKFSLAAKTYGLVLLLVLIYIVRDIIRAENPSDFSRLSTNLKVYMIAGLLFVIFWNV